MNVLDKASSCLTERRKKVVMSAKEKATEIVEIGLASCLETFKFNDSMSIGQESSRLLEALVSKLQE